MPANIDDTLNNYKLVEDFCPCQGGGAKVKKTAKKPVKRKVAKKSSGKKVAKKSSGKKVAKKSSGKRVAKKSSGKRVAKKSSLSQKLDEAFSKFFK